MSTSDINRILARLSFRGQRKIRVIRQMQRMISAGIPVTKVLDTLYDLYSDGGRRRGDATAIALSEWRRRHVAGKSLSDSMGDWISPAERMIIEAGEQSDNLAPALQDALYSSAAAAEIRNTVITALLYPVALLCVVILMLLGHAYKIAPAFASIVDPSQWTGAAAIMYALSSFVADWIFLIVPGLLALGAAIFVSMPYLSGPVRTRLDKLPPWSIYKVVVGASFILSLRGFVVAGIPIQSALRRVSRIANPYLKSRVEAISRHFHMGLNLGRAMKAAGHDFPDPAIFGEIGIYSELDGFAGNLDLLAREWVSQTKERTKAVSKVVNLAMLFLITLLIGLMSLSMFELQNLIRQSLGG